MAQEAAGSRERPASDGRFIDSQYINGDPVWVVYQGTAEEWLFTEKPQSVFNFAHGDLIAVAGEDPGLYGYRFVARDCLFSSKEDAADECRKRNG